MFTLRILEKERKQIDLPFEEVIENFNIGNSYSIIKNGITEFNEIMHENYPDEDKSKIKALLINEAGECFFVYHETDLMKFTYFIMSDNGKTFEKL